MLNFESSCVTRQFQIAQQSLCAFALLMMPFGSTISAAEPFIVVLGIAQDAGYPQAGCQKPCCLAAWKNPEQRRFTASLAIVDPDERQRWIIDCTPNFPDQLRMLDEHSDFPVKPVVNGILLTHAHIGHYSGLVHLGREVMGANQVPVYAMPRMAKFLETSGPWSQLVQLKNIELKPLREQTAVRLNPRIQVVPLQVPHRDEFSETVGFRIVGPNKSALFIPDIDKWERWTTDIETEIAKVDVAWLDGTFFDNDELPGRDMSQIPHPFIAESLQRFSKLSQKERNKVRFIHLNHTNAGLSSAAARQKVTAAGHHIAKQGARFGL